MSVGVETPLDRIKEARKSLDEANEILKKESKNALREAISKVFDDNPNAQGIGWAQKDSEYNDEGMYPGVFGPAFTDLDPLQENSFRDLWHSAPWVYGDGGKTDPRLIELEEVLAALGSQVLSELFGDENIVIARRSDKGFTIHTEYAGV